MNFTTSSSSITTLIPSLITILDNITDTSSNTSNNNTSNNTNDATVDQESMYQQNLYFIFFLCLLFLGFIYIVIFVLTKMCKPCMTKMKKICAKIRNRHKIVPVSSKLFSCKYRKRSSTIPKEHTKLLLDALEIISFTSIDQSIIDQANSLRLLFKNQYNMEHKMEKIWSEHFDEISNIINNPNIEDDVDNNQFIDRVKLMINNYSTIICNI